MVDEAPRSRQARAAAEQALVRVVHHYGSRPEFVLLGGLVPQLLCSTGEFEHAGTTDVDVQVDLEIACGSVNAVRLEKALEAADFRPDAKGVWRCVMAGAVIKFELLADLNDQPAPSNIKFDSCHNLCAANLRGTGFAAKDFAVRKLTATVDSKTRSVEVNVTGLAGFLLAKIAAAHSRRLSKDWYDLAFVLLHNDAGGPTAAADAVKNRFAAELTGPIRTALDDLFANFGTATAQGPLAYSAQMHIDHPNLDVAEVAADAVVAVDEFRRRLFGS